MPRELAAQKKIEMIIKETQINTLGTRSKERFIQKTIVFLKENTPEWAETRNDDEIAEYIMEVIELLKIRQVLKEINIQRFLFHQIKYDIRIPLSQEVEEILRYDYDTENNRLDSLVKAIQKSDVS